MTFWNKLLWVLLCLPATLLAEPSVDWNGYTQIRFSENFNKQHSFSVRRTKLWLKGQRPDASRWGYKVQALYRWQGDGALVLQDAFVEYRTDLFCLRFGQMTPDFSLERSQHDFVLPLLERAQIINALIPTAESGARDIGMQTHLHSGNDFWSGSFGVFNGEGGNRKGNADNRFLFTTRQLVQWHPRKSIELSAGMSAAYRHATAMAFRHILASDSLFSGDDVRWGVEARAAGQTWSVQGEYLHTSLNTTDAYGYYLLADYRVSAHQLVALQAERFQAPNVTTTGNPIIWNFGYTYFIQQYRAKVMADLRTEHRPGKNYYTFMVQTQLFFN